MTFSQQHMTEDRQAMTDTPNILDSFSQFKMLDEHLTFLRKAGFMPLVTHFDLADSSSIDRIATHHLTLAGIYFWSMRDGDSVFRVYVGRTKHLCSRIKNYTDQFQPHSPNDYKLRIFQSFISGLAPHVEFDLLFSEKPLEQLTQAENRAIKALDPILNKRQHPSEAARRSLREAFAAYYRSEYEAMLPTRELD